MKYEYLIKIPSCPQIAVDTVIYMQEGDGSQLDREDRLAGYDSYVDYEIQDGVNSGDGGIYMYNSDQNDVWVNLFPEVIKYALDLDTCPPFFIEEIDKGGKMYTFRFYFTNKEGREDATKFCASTEEEAINLFSDFQKENQCETWNCCEVVLNTDDKNEYGDNYGTPEEYKEKTA